MSFDKRRPPKRHQKFASDYPDLLDAYEVLGQRLTEAGPLNLREIRLCKLAMALGANLRGATYAQTGLALEEGILPEEIRHVAIMALSTLGLPRMMSSLSWVDQVVESRANENAAE